MLKNHDINYKIIPISEKYIESYRQAVGSVAREKKYLIFTDAPSPEISKKFVANNLKNHMPHFIALDINKNIVIGWCDIVAYDRKLLSHSGILGIGIISGYRGYGIGRKLLNIAIDKAKKIGLTRIELTVRESNNKAYDLYKKIGFNTEGLHKNSIYMNGKYENMISMALLI